MFTNLVSASLFLPLSLLAKVGLPVFKGHIVHGFGMVIAVPDLGTIYFVPARKVVCGVSGICAGASLGLRGVDFSF
jgi:hypothetical protein